MNEILEELKKENKAPTKNNIREKLGLERIEQNTKMNEEIKEILDNFKSYEDRYNKYNETEFIIIKRDITLLLNYITNLQEENQKLKETNEEHRKINGELRKENQKLVKAFDELEKWLKEDKEKAGNNFEMGRCFNMFDILNKLTELKGGSDE